MFRIHTLALSHGMSNRLIGFESLRLEIFVFNFPPRVFVADLVCLLLLQQPKPMPLSKIEWLNFGTFISVWHAMAWQSLIFLFHLFTCARALSLSLTHGILCATLSTFTTWFKFQFILQHSQWILDSALSENNDIEIHKPPILCSFYSFAKMELNALMHCMNSIHRNCIYRKLHLMFI